MRRTEQALDAVQVGHVVVVGLGWVGAELLSAVRRVD
jgi:tRNA A37 threonylcarbamoyladenosine dehydratase